MGLIEPETVWSPSPGPQTALLTAPFDEVCYGGSRGGGKTDGVLGEWASHAADHGKNAIGLMVRRQSTELVETIERSKVIYEPLGATYNEQKKMWTMANGARLRFAYLERDSDAGAYQGHSYTRVYIEEAGNFPSPTPILKLMGTLRSGAGVKPRMILTCNPGGPGHQWVKARYIDPAPLGYQPITEVFENPFTGAKVPKTRIYIPSRVTDNKFLGEDYIATLQQVGNENLVKAWLLGDWNIVEGAFFDTWSHRNVIKPFAIPADWLRFRAADWGYSAPFSMGWYALAGDDAHEYGLTRGCLVRYRELYTMRPGQPNVGLRRTTEQLAEQIKDMSGGESYAYSVIDPAAFAEAGGPSIAERFARAGVVFKRADNRRLGSRGAMAGWDLVRARIDGEDGKPMFVNFETCVHLTRTLPILQHDANRPEDLDTSQEDHCFAAGTLVETAYGPTPIESLPERGWVLSLDGYRFYCSARMTRRSAELVRVHLANGRTITCTPDHRFVVDHGEFCYARDLAGRSVAWTPPASVAQSKSSTASGIISAAATSSARANASTARYGNTIMARFLTAITSTIATMTARAMRWLTLSASPHSITSPIVMVPSMPSVGKSTSARPWPLRVIGTERRPARHGTPPTMNGASGPSWSAAPPPHASNAEMSSRWPRLQPPAPSFAATIAGHVLCERVEPLPERADVYCLTVPSAGVFAIEGGLLVSNCADELRYAVMSRPWIPKPKPKPEEGRAIREITMEEAWRLLPETTRQERI